MTATTHYITSDTDAGLDTCFYETQTDLDQAMVEIIVSHIPEAANAIGTEEYPTWQDYWDNNDLEELHRRDSASYHWGTHELPTAINTPSFEIRPVIEMDGDCVSYACDADYVIALRDIVEDTGAPAFNTFWTVYLQNDMGQAEAIADRKDKRTAEQLAKRFTSMMVEPSRNLTVTAACVWEAILENICDNNDLWVSWRNDVGAAELREEVYNLAVWVDQVYNACIKLDNESACEVPFDWEFVPAALSFISLANHESYPGPDDYPKPENIAPHVIGKLK